MATDRGCVRRVTFPATRENGGEHRAREDLAMSLHEAIQWFDPHNPGSPLNGRAGK